MKCKEKYLTWFLSLTWLDILLINVLVILLTAPDENITWLGEGPDWAKQPLSPNCWGAGEGGSGASENVRWPHEQLK